MADDTRSKDVPVVRGTDLRTFLIADIRGYTRFTRDHGDEAASAVAARFAAVVRGAVPGFEGELLELRGDEALCVFASARQALRAAVEIQRRLRTSSEGEEVFPLGVGTGLDAGEAVPTEGGYRGGALNLAARLCGQAAGGEILATERLVGLTGPVSGVHWGRPRAIRLKGVRDPERVVRVVPDETIAPPPAPPPEPATPSRRRRLLAAGLLILVALCGVVLVVIQRGGSASTAVRSVATPPRSLAIIDPSKRRMVGDVRLPTEPESMIVGSGHAWIGSADQTVTPVSLTKPRAGQPIGLGIDPAALAYGHGSVWAFDGYSRLAQIDAQHQSQIGAPKRLWHCTVVAAIEAQDACAAEGLAAVGNEIWVGNDSGLPVTGGVIDRINMTNLKVVGHVPNVEIGPLAAGQGQVWLWGGVGRTVDLISVASHTITQRTSLGVPASYTGGGIAVGFGYAWAEAPGPGKLFGIAAGDKTPSYTHLVPHGVTSITTGGNWIWLGVDDGRILQLNPFTGRTVHSYPVGHTNPIALAYSDGRVWAALATP